MAFEDHVGPIFGMTAITLVAMAGSAMVGGGIIATMAYGMFMLETATVGLITTAVVVGICLIAAMLVASLTFGTAQFSFLNALAAGKPESVGEAVHRGWKLFPGFFWVNILAGLATVAGLIVFIIPGIIIGLRLAFVPFIFINEGIRGSAALRRSWELTRGISWIVLARMYVLVIGMIIGGITQVIPVIGPLIIGPFIVNPLEMLWMAHFYRNVSAVKAQTPAYTDAYSTAQKIGLVAIVGGIFVLIAAFQLVAFGLLSGENTSSWSSENDRYRSEYNTDSRYQFPSEESAPTDSFDDTAPIEWGQ